MLLSDLVCVCVILENPIKTLLVYVFGYVCIERDAEERAVLYTFPQVS